MMVDKSTTLDLRVLRLAYEGAEERLIQAGRPVDQQSSVQLVGALAHKFNYVINVSTIYKLEQVDHTFKRLLEDALEVKKGDQCIIDKTVSDSSGWQTLLPGVSFKNFDFHFENVTEDANPLNSWQSVHDKSLTTEELKNKEKLLCRVKTHKLRGLEQLSGLVDLKEPREVFSDNSKLEMYLQKRFLSPRLEKCSNLPQPYLIHTMDFMKMLSFLDFVAAHGLHFDSMESFYKRFSLSYPEEVTSSKADLENFKNFVKEFVHLLAYRGSKSFSESVILCGFEVILVANLR